MGFLDNAKNKISQSFGEETVGEVNFKAEVLEKDKEKHLNGMKPPKKTKKPKERKTDVLGGLRENILEATKGANAKKNPKPLDEVESERTDDGARIVYDDENLDFMNGDDNDQNPDAFSDNVDYDYDDDENSDSVSSAKRNSLFAIDEDAPDYFEEKQREHDEDYKRKYEGVPDLQVLNGRIQDVLEVMNIPPTFDIEENIFMPDDIDEIDFDLQAPYGYEQSQVRSFVASTKLTIERYVQLLMQRNAHVAQLATAIDKLQVDNNNLRFETEVASGLNVMPTSDDDDLQNLYTEAKLHIRTLEDQLRNATRGDGLSSDERERYNELQDELSIIRRESQRAQEENQDLRARLAYFQEKLDESVSDDQLKGAVFQSEAVQVVKDTPDEERSALPVAPSTPPESLDSYRTPKTSAFYVDGGDEVDLGAIVPSNILDESTELTTRASASSIVDNSHVELLDESDDEVDQIMREWNNN